MFFLEKSTHCSKMPKIGRFASFWEPEACGQIVLPDKSYSIGQIWVENAKIKKLKWYILRDFQTVWKHHSG